MQLKRKIWNDFIKNEKIIWKNNCPFCFQEEKLTILKTNFWKIQYNKYPYWGIKNHILVIPNRHIELTKDLNNSELIDLKKIHNYLFNFYKWEKYFSFIRETFKWRSIKHLHYHYLPINISSNEIESILNKQWY